MRIRNAGKVTDGLWCLGSEASNIYLLEGDQESMIVSGGMSYLVPTLLEQFQVCGIDETRITKLLILHAHFDHIGAIPFFKRRNLSLEVYASARGWEILGMPKAITTINKFGRDVAVHMGFEGVYSQYDIEWGDDISGKTVVEGDHLGVEPLEGIVYETPGHSSCSVSFYVPSIKALFPSDGGGVPYKEMIIAAGNSNFTKYQESLEKLKDLDVEFLCADHYGYIIGEEAKNYIRESIQAARARRSEIEEVYLQSRDMEVATRELVERFYRDNPDYLLTPEIFAGVYHQMLRHLVKQLE
jgi:glyoxylase-like metal-dependent hydrolase (beta-lactamase superfamily II)